MPTPVDYDPFAQKSGARPTPVDHDPFAPTSTPQIDTLPANPIDAAVQGFRQAKHQVGQDWRAYVGGFKSGSPKATGPTGEPTPADLAADRFGGDLLSMGINPLREALASALRGPASVIRGPANAIREDKYKTANVGDEARGLVDTATYGASMYGPARGMAGKEMEVPAIKPLVAAATEARDRWRIGRDLEPGAPPTAEVRAKAKAPAMNYLATQARRLDPTGEKLKANALEARGKPITAAEALGRPAQTALKVMGRRTGQTPDELEALLRGRAADAPSRVVEDFGHATGLDPEAIEGNFAAHAAKLRAAAAPLYQDFYATPGPIMTPRLGELLNRPSMEKALARAASIAREEGINPHDIGLETKSGQVPIIMDGKPLVRPDGTPIMMQQNETVEVKTPSAKTWDYIKRALDDVLDDQRDSTTKKLKTDNNTRAITSTLHDLRAELTNPETPWGPKYAAALDAGGEPLRMEEAYRDAPKLMGNSITEAQFKARWEKMSPSQKQSFVAGVAADARNKAAGGKQRITDMLTDAYKRKLRQIMPADKADDLIQRLDDEQFLKVRGARMTPGVGADTSETLMGSGEADQQMEEARKTISKLHNHGIRAALTHLIASPVVGAIRGAQAPMSEAERDIIGALLQGPPSALAQALEAHGASAAEAKSAATALRSKDVVDTIKARAGLSVYQGNPPPDEPPP